METAFTEEIESPSKISTNAFISVLTQHTNSSTQPQSADHSQKYGCSY